jgi:hypothetical protein
MMTNRWTVSFSREQLDAMLAKIDIDAIIARVVSGEYDDVSAVRIQELETELAAVPVEAIKKLADMVWEEWGESYSAEVVYEWLDKREKGAANG